MITVKYSINGKSNADGLSIQLAKEIIREGKDYTTSTESLIDALRLMVAKGEIPKKNIQFVLKGKLVSVDDNGRYLNHPGEYSDVDKISIALLEESLKQVREMSRH